MITEEMRNYWKEQDEERFSQLMAEAKKANIPAKDIQKMIDTLKPQWDEMIENLDKNGFFDQK